MEALVFHIGTKIEEKYSIFIMKYANYDILHVILPEM